MAKDDKSPSKGKFNTARHWLERIAERVLKPLHDSDAAISASDNRHWIIPLDIVTTIVRFCQELEGPRTTAPYGLAKEDCIFTPDTTSEIDMGLRKYCFNRSLRYV